MSVLPWVHLLVAVCAAAQCGAAPQGPAPGPSTRLSDTLDLLWTVVDRAVKSAVEPLVTRINTRLDTLDTKLDDLQAEMSGVKSDLNLTVKSAVEPLVTQINTRLDSVQSELSDVTSDLSITKTELSAQSAGLASRLDNMQTTLYSVRELTSQQLESVSAQVAVLWARDCSDLLPSTASGVHLLRPEVHAYCDMETDGGGWTVFQRRADVQPHEDFYRDWDDYKQGFGDPRREFWWGNDNIWRTASLPNRRYTLRIDMEDFDGERRYAVYQSFSIASEADGYRLTVGDYSGDAGDSLTPNDKDAIHAGMRFSTKDRDHDNNGSSCAKGWKGGWWYNSCHYANLNGLYLAGENVTLYKGVTWKTWRGQGYSLKSVEMKIRPMQ